MKCWVAAFRPTLFEIHIVQTILIITVDFMEMSMEETRIQILQVYIEWNFYEYKCVKFWKQFNKQGELMDRMFL